MEKKVFSVFIFVVLFMTFAQNWTFTFSIASNAPNVGSPEHLLQDIKSNVAFGYANLSYYGKPTRGVFNVKGENKVTTIVTNGWSWRASVSLENITEGVYFNNAIDITIARKPDNSDIYLVAVLDSFRKNVSGNLYLVSYIDVFLVNYTRLIVNGYNATPRIRFVYRYNYTRLAEDYDRIVKIAVDWINNTDAYLIFANASRPSGNTDYYSVVVVHIKSGDTQWFSLGETIIIRGEGPVKGLRIYRSSTRFLVVFSTISFVSFLNTLGPNITFYDLFSNVYKSLVFQVSGYSVSDVWLSNAYITTDNYALVVLAAKITDGFSVLYYVSWNFDNNSSPVAGAIYRTTNLGDDYGVYADFKDPVIAPINNGTNFLVVFDAFTSVDNYLTYGISSYSAGSLSDLENVILNFSISSAVGVGSVDYNISDATTVVFWLDSSVGASEVMYAKLNYSSDLILGQTNYSVVTRTKTIRFSLELRSQKDIIVAHISKNSTGYAKAYVTVGFFDTDHDGIGDYEEQNIYSSRYPGLLYNDSDSDNDGLGDGAEILLYITKPNNTDTDNDHISDFDEVVVYDTYPTDSDTDNDGLLDGEEVFGMEILIPTSNVSVLVYSDPHLNDTDNDGLDDYSEVSIGWVCFVTYPDGSAVSYKVRSNPNSTDTDHDGLLDLGEYINSTDPWVNDTDHDGLLDLKEVSRGLDPNDWDSDDDGLGDYEELVVYGTDPLRDDTDGDGLSDYREIIEGWLVVVTLENNTIISYRVYSDALRYDTDNDTLDDYIEYVIESDPHSNDTDYDGLLDYNEYSIGTNLTRWDTDNDNISDHDEVYIYSTDPLSNDSDGDGLSDYQEVYGVYNQYLNASVRTDPNDWDSDGDGLSDYNESTGFIINGTIYYTDPLNRDTDNDSLIDGYEYRVETNPINPDTDGDGLSDGSEVHGVNITGIGIRYPDPLSNDSDGDGLIDGEEANVYFTDPTEYDSDGDGLSDKEELIGWNVTVIMANNITKVYHVSSDPLNWDSDGDGLSDYDEKIFQVDPLNNDTDSDGLSDSSENSLGLNVSNWDSDGDGLSDYEEVRIYATNPLDWDSDGDGLSDYEEVRIYATNPNVRDTDNDSISDWDEVVIYSTDPLNNDTDSDNLLDGSEIMGINITGVGLRSTDPLNNDSDGDGLSDYEECFGVAIRYTRYTSDPTDRDSDDDGLDDYQEVMLYLTNPLTPDSDGDGLVDGKEVVYGTVPTSNDSDGDGLSDYEEIIIYKTDPLSNDSDGDGLSDYEEIMGIFVNEKIGIVKIDPRSNDTDNDGLSDLQEISGFELLRYGLVKTDPTNRDTDGDGLSDYEEVVVRKTNPMSIDSDGDGLSDYEEVIKMATNPNSVDSDNDFIPDNLDFPFPNLNNFLILAIIVVLIAFIYARNYGLMRNWRKDIILFGLSDAGGIPMFVVPEDVQTKYDINLISSGLLGVHAITGEISGEQVDTLVLSGKTPIFVRRGEKTVAWVFLKQSYPRTIKKLIVIHKELESNYAHLLEEWSGMPEEVEEIKYWLLSRLGKETREFKADKELLEEFEKEFSE